MKTIISFIILCAFSLNMMAQTSIVVKSGNEETLMLLSNEPTITIGETIKVTDGTTTKEYGTDKRVTLFVDHSVSVTDNNNVKTSVKLVSGDAFALNDNIKGISVRENVSNLNLTYTRTFNNNNWQALYVPFNIPVANLTENFEVAQMDGTNSTSSAIVINKLTEGALVANTPYFIKLKDGVATGEKVISVTGATLAQTNAAAHQYGDFTLTGIYEVMNGTAMQTANAYALKGGVFYPAANDATLGAFRFYLTGVNSTAGVKIFVDDETGIDNLTPSLPTREREIFNLNGQQIQKLQKGVNIVNGKKVLY